MAKNGLLTNITANIPYIMNVLGGQDIPKKDILTKYFNLEGVQGEADFGGTKDKYGRYPFGCTFATALTKLKKAGVISIPSRSVYTLEDASSVPSEFTLMKTPVVQETTQEDMVEVSVSNPAVIEAHIDTTTNELVENVGGSQDWRKPLDEVEDGYITSSVPSSVQVSTTTLEPVVDEAEPVVEETQEEVEFVEAPVEPVEVQEVVEVAPVAETPLEDDLDIFDDEIEETQEVETHQPSYDLKTLRKSASFDPLTITIKGVTGSYEVYRDMDARNIVLTQKGREDYVIVPVDVDLERLEGIDPRYAKYAMGATKIFETSANHKDGCVYVIKALISCTDKCSHTDDFGGLVERCVNPHCPLLNIWGGVAIYVNPNETE